VCKCKRVPASDEREKGLTTRKWGTQTPKARSGTSAGGHDVNQRPEGVLRQCKRLWLRSISRSRRSRMMQDMMIEVKVNVESGTLDS
jgi:hypothetical protein